MHLICRGHLDGEVLAEVYVQEGKGFIDGELVSFDEIYVHDYRTNEIKCLDECEYLDTTYRDLYYYALEYLQAESLSVEEA